MPALSILCVLGSCYSLYRAKRIIAPILLIWLAVLPMMLILLSAVVVSHRYTGDFCSFLISVSAISLAALSSQLVRLRRSVVIFLNFITCVSIFVTLMWCIRFQGTESFGVTPKDITKYNILAERIDRLLGVSPKP